MPASAESIGAGSGSAHGLVYDRPATDEWVTPEHSCYRMECCDCALVHGVDFRVVDAEGRPIEGANVQFRMRRDPEQSRERRTLRFPALIRAGFDPVSFLKAVTGVVAP